MRRLPTLVLVAFVAAVAAAALLDAVRSEEPRATAETPTEAPVEATRAAGRPASEPFGIDLTRHTDALHAADAVGLLVVADPDCRVELVPLPELERRPLELCSRRLAEAGGYVTLGGAPTGSRALRPDGARTVIRAGALRELRVRDRDSRLLLPRDDVERLVGDSRAELVEVAWATNSRFFGIVRGAAEPRFRLVVIENGRLVRSACCFEDLRGLRASPRGTYADVRSERGVLVFRRDGTRVPLPPRVGRPPGAVAWSPDERLVAVARGGAVDVLRMDDPSRTAVVARLPIEAADLRWVASDGHVLLPESAN